MSEERKEFYIQNSKDTDDFYVYHSMTGMGEAAKAGQKRYGEDFIIRFANNEDISNYQDKILAKCNAELVTLIKLYRVDTNGLVFTPISKNKEVEVTE